MINKFISLLFLSRHYDDDGLVVRNIIKIYKVDRRGLWWLWKQEEMWCASANDCGGTSLYSTVARIQQEPLVCTLRPA